MNIFKTMALAALTYFAPNSAQAASFADDPENKETTHRTETGEPVNTQEQIDTLNLTIEQAAEAFLKQQEQKIIQEAITTGSYKNVNSMLRAYLNERRQGALFAMRTVKDFDGDGNEYEATYVPTEILFAAAEKMNKLRPQGSTFDLEKSGFDDNNVLLVCTTKEGYTTTFSAEYDSTTQELKNLRMVDTDDPEITYKLKQAQNNIIKLEDVNEQSAPPLNTPNNKEQQKHHSR